MKDNRVRYTIDGRASYAAEILRELEDGRVSLVAFLDDQRNPHTMTMGHTHYEQDCRNAPDADEDGYFRAGTWHTEAEESKAIQTREAKAKAAAKTPAPAPDSLI